MVCAGLVAGHSLLMEAAKTEPATARIKFELVPRVSVGDGLKGSLALRPLTGASDAVVLTVHGLAPVLATLPAGTRWQVAADLPGFWVPPRVVTAGPAGTEMVQDLPCWPLGSIAGNVRAPDKMGRLPKKILVGIVTSPKPGTQTVLPDERLACPVDAKGAWRCDLPAEKLDLALSAAGFIPVYRWGVPVVAGKTLQLGTLDLKPGASVAAWALAEDGRIAADQALAELVPLQAEGSETRVEDRLRSTATRSRVRKDGFVQLTGVAPGTYVLEVNQPGYASARAFPIQVWPGAETFVQQPLVLKKPLRLELTITPPLDWLGKPWKARIFRASELSGGWEREPAFEGSAAADGMVLVPAQSPGRFWVEVLDSRNNTMFGDFDFRVSGPEDARRDIKIDLVTVKGEVHFGKEPLAAALWFGGRNASPGVEMESDAAGKFQGVLPKRGKWRVELAAKRPSLEAERRVEVTPDRAGRAFVDIRLPDTHLLGRVIDDGDHPVGRARVEVSTGLLVPLQLQTDDQGAFETRGLEEGLTNLVAVASTADGKLTSDAVIAMVVEGRDVGPVELRVRRMKQITGRVVSAMGPVAGATIEAAPRRPDFLHVDSTRTDLDGAFSARVPGKTDRAILIVSPPGNGLKAFEVTADSSPKVLPVIGEVGALEVKVPYSQDEFQEQNMTFWLLQDGLPLPWTVLYRWANGHGDSFANHDFSKISIPALTPGQYQACFVPLAVVFQENQTGWAQPQGDCATGTLISGAMLQLEPKRSH